MGDCLYKRPALPDDVLYHAGKWDFCGTGRGGACDDVGRGDKRIPVESDVLYHHYADHYADADKDYLCPHGEASDAEPELGDGVMRMIFHLYLEMGWQ